MKFRFRPTSRGIYREGTLVANREIDLCMVRIGTRNTYVTRNLHSNASVSSGFTLVEMLVAMALTLLMMAALARGFAFIGERVRDSRSNVELSNELRDVTTRLNDELERCTVTLQPNDGGADQAGYFLYYEGPLTDATSSLFSARGAGAATELPDSKYGDLDDYIAFTAVAPPNTWFTGKVPRFILEEKSAEETGIPYMPTAADPDPFEPVVIRSRYAEIVYYASPEYDENVAITDATYPKYIDVDGGVKLTGAAPLGGPGDENGFPDRLKIHRRVLLIRPDLNLQDERLPVRNNGTVTFMEVDAYPTNWQVAMSSVHQQCDLSLRRVLSVSTATRGRPTTRVAANSLEDLTKPHNRFAHVRIPQATLGAGTSADDTSMPVLALGKPPTILGMLTATSSDRIAAPVATSGDVIVTPDDWCGFLRPEFVLGDDRIHTDTGDIWWSRDARRGEDLLANNAVGFDVRIFDPDADWLVDTTTNLVVGPSDAGYREEMNTTPLTIIEGGFVDLGYPALAGGALRGWDSRTKDKRSTSSSDSAAIPMANNASLISEFSGIRARTSSALSAYRTSLYRSGHLVLNNSNEIRLFQPTFDTYTSHYERDGLLQSFRRTPVAPPTTPATYNYRGTVWTTEIVGADEGSDGIDTDGIFGVDDDQGERETLPPFDIRPESIRITIRLENPSTRQIRQSSVVHRD